jgi:Na+/H+-dicarboxylate symporter
MTDGEAGRHPLELLHPRSLKHLSGELQHLIRGRLWLQVLVGMVAGIVVGVMLGPSAGWVEPDVAAVVGNWLAFPGQLFLALIQMIVIPLVVASIIRGLAATEDLDQLRRTGLRVVLFFVATTALAILIGVVLAYVIQPGRFVDTGALQASLGASSPAAAQAAPAAPNLVELPQKLVGLLPTNPLGSMVQADMLQIVIFGMVIGVALVMMPPQQSRPLLDLTGSLQNVCMTVVRWAMWLAPYAVFGLLAQLMSKIGLDALVGLAVYVGTVLLGLLAMLCVYLALVRIVLGHRPWAFLKSLRELLLLAFSTSSSAAVMPLSIKTAEEKLGVRPSISQFVIPLGATINMNGTALYQGVAAIFLAQVFGVDIGVGGLVLLVLTAVGAAIGAPGTPGIGIVIMAMLLTTIGVPAAGIALIMGVDRILDMCRTAINVAGDVVAASLMDKWVGGPTPAEDAIAAERERDRIREATGEDIVVEGS